MKRLLLVGLAVCALITTSCSEQEITENIVTNQRQLSFAAGLGKQITSKVGELNNSELAGNAGTNGIILHAYQSDGASWSKWYDDELIYDGAKWNLKNSTRFSNANKTKYISYFSTVPGALTNPMNFDNPDFTPGGSPTFTYTVADNSSTQEDLIAGVTDVAANQTNITFSMRHLLSQINFGTKGYKGVKIRIRNIIINDVGNSADFVYFFPSNSFVGKWSQPAVQNTSYEYYNWGGNAIADNPQPEVPATANKGDIYIFGDGGNWGPGVTNNIYYPVGTSGAWEPYNTGTPQTGLKNSLMLMPQQLSATSKVTFEYQIQEASGSYIVGSNTDWKYGEFSLDFPQTKLSVPDGYKYEGKWEPNYRYVYLIDFTDLLNGAALTFKVDVKKWENHDYQNTNGDNGIVNVFEAKKPTKDEMNTVFDNDTWYIASKGTSYPDTWVQVIHNVEWDLSSYGFTNIQAGESFNLSFDYVIFNKTEAGNNAKITLIMPNGFIIEHSTGSNNSNINIEEDGNKYHISLGDKSNMASIKVKRL